MGAEGRANASESSQTHAPPSPASGRFHTVHFWVLFLFGRVGITSGEPHYLGFFLSFIRGGVHPPTSSPRTRPLPADHAPLGYPCFFLLLRIPVVQLGSSCCPPPRWLYPHHTGKMSLLKPGRAPRLYPTILSYPTPSSVTWSSLHRLPDHLHFLLPGSSFPFPCSSPVGAPEDPILSPVSRSPAAGAVPGHSRGAPYLHRALAPARVFIPRLSPSTTWHPCMSPAAGQAVGASESLWSGLSGPFRPTHQPTPPPASQDSNICF